MSAKLDGQGQSQENKESKKEVPLTLRQAILERDCVVNGKCVTEMETVAPVRDPILDSANGGIYRRETADSIDAPTFPSNEEQKESSAPSKPPSVMETLLGVLRTHIQDSEWRDILDKLDKAHEGKETKASDGVSEQSEEKAADKEDSGMRKSNLPQSLYDEPFDEDN